MTDVLRFFGVIAIVTAGATERPTALLTIKAKTRACVCSRVQETHFKLNRVEIRQLESGIKRWPTRSVNKQVAQKAK